MEHPTAIPSEVAMPGDPVFDLLPRTSHLLGETFALLKRA
jgi:hypothetical protein